MGSLKDSLFKINSDITHFHCVSCGKIKPIDKGAHKAKVAYSTGSNTEQDRIDLYAKWKVLCPDCFEGKEVKDEQENSKS